MKECGTNYTTTEKHTSHTWALDARTSTNMTEPSTTANQNLTMNLQRSNQNQTQNLKQKRLQKLETHQCLSNHYRRYSHSMTRRPPQPTLHPSYHHQQLNALALLHLACNNIQ